MLRKLFSVHGKDHIVDMVQVCNIEVHIAVRSRPQRKVHAVTAFMTLVCGSGTADHCRGEKRLHLFSGVSGKNPFGEIKRPRVIVEICIFLQLLLRPRQAEDYRQRIFRLFYRIAVQNIPDTEDSVRLFRISGRVRGKIHVVIIAEPCEERPVRIKRIRAVYADTVIAVHHRVVFGARRRVFDPVKTAVRVHDAAKKRRVVRGFGAESGGCHLPLRGHHIDVGEIHAKIRKLHKT